MAEIEKNGIPHLRHLHGDFRLVWPSHPMMPRGHDFRKGKLLITDWEGVLPTPEFSKKRLDEMYRLAERKNPVEYRKPAAMFAKRLIDRVAFEESLGCWYMPLPAEHDGKGRARYPRFDSTKFGFEYTNASYHQVAYETLLGLKIPKELMGTNGNSTMQRMPVDHLCHSHACCNPYHLEVVSHAENTRRGGSVRLGKIQPHLAQKAFGTFSYSEALDHFEEFAVRLDKIDQEQVKILKESDEPTIEHETLF